MSNNTRTPTTKPHSMVVGIQPLDVIVINSRYYGWIAHSVDNVIMDVDIVHDAEIVSW